MAMDDKHGAARAICLTSLALNAAGAVVSSTSQLGQVYPLLAGLHSSYITGRTPLDAWLMRTHGEIAMETARESDGHKLLHLATTVFFEHGDRQSLSELRQLPTFETVRLMDQGNISSPRAERQSTAWLDADDRPLVLGRPVKAFLSVDEAPPPRLLLLDDPGPEFGGGHLIVLLIAEGGDTQPAFRAARLDPRAELEPLEFTVVPQRAGSLHLTFRVYNADDGSLLQEFRCPAVPVIDHEGHEIDDPIRTDSRQHNGGAKDGATVSGP
jgi:hypothetical protein